MLCRGCPSAHASSATATPGAGPVAAGQGGAAASAGAVARQPGAPCCMRLSRAPPAGIHTCSNTIRVTSLFSSCLDVSLPDRNSAAACNASVPSSTGVSAGVLHEVHASALNVLPCGCAQVSYARKLVSKGDVAAPSAAPGNDGSGDTAVASPILAPVATATMLVTAPPATPAPAALETPRQQSAPAALESVTVGDTSSPAATASAGQPAQPPAADVSAATAAEGAATLAPASHLPGGSSAAAAAVATAAPAAPTAHLPPGSDAANSTEPAAGVSRPSLQVPTLFHGL
jgi:flagellar hook-length control protein FliK